MSEFQDIGLSPLPVPQFQFYYSYLDAIRSPNDPEKPHIHSNYEFYIHVSGDVSFLVNNRLYPVSPGDVIISRPGDVHLCVCQEAVQHARYCCWISCPEDSPLLDFIHRPDFSNILHFSESTRKELLRLFHRLRDAEAQGRQIARTAYLFRVLTILSEGTHMEPEVPALPTAMQQVLDYIRENFTALHCVEDIAHNCHISSSTLNRWFRSYLQLSPHKYVEALKLSLAQRLLLEGKSVTEVCNRAGFTDCSRFIAIFKAKFGRTPLQYQKQREV